MNHVRGALRSARRLASLALALTPALSLAQHPGGNVPLRDIAGNAIQAGSKTPYSPERTCGGCHDVALITQGYHFQQGRTNGAAALQVSDTFLGAMIGAYDASGNATRGTGAWWKQSDGMYGKW
jgi:hypothetical protein